MAGTTSDWLLNYLQGGGQLPGLSPVENPQNTQIVLGDDSVPGIAPPSDPPASGPDGGAPPQVNLPRPPNPWDPWYTHWQYMNQYGVDVDQYTALQQRHNPQLGALGGLMGGKEAGAYPWSRHPSRVGAESEAQEGPDGASDAPGGGEGTQGAADGSEQAQSPWEASRQAGQWQHGEYGTNLPGSPYTGNPFSPFLYDSQTGSVQVTDPSRQAQSFQFLPEMGTYRNMRQRRGLASSGDAFQPDGSARAWSVSPWAFGAVGQFGSGFGYQGPGGLSPTRAPKGLYPQMNQRTQFDPI